MLKFMRVHLGKTFFFVIVGAIALVFVLGGVMSSETRFGNGVGAGDVANVGGERISAQELAQAVERDVQNYRNLGMDIPPEMLNQLRAGSLQNLVREKLMLVEARRLGVQASEREVMAEIQKMPYFQDKEKKTFDVDLYRKILAANGLNTGQFEERVKNQLTNQRLVSFLEGRIRVTPGEVEREYKIANETRNLEFVRYTREDGMKKIVVDGKQVDAYLNDKAKEPSIATYYAANNAQYNKPEQICARHILKRFASPKDELAATAPKEFLALSPNAGNFAKIAEKNSDDPGSKAKGGDLDCFGKGVMDKAFEATAFSTPVGKVSAPVKSKFGWHYIYVYKKNEAVNRPLDKVKREIAEILLKRDRLDEIRKINLAAAEEAVKRFPAKADQTGPFNSLEGSIPKIGRADEITKAAFDPKAKIQTGPQLFEAAGGVIVARIKEKKSADMSKLAAEKDKQTQTLRERKLRAFLPAWMEDVQKRTKVSMNLGAMGNGEM